MKKSRVLFLSSVLALVSGFCGCNSDSNSDYGIQVRNYANTGCKPTVTRGEDGQTGKTVEFIDYKGMDDGFLSFKHVNAQFTCYSQPRIEATVSGSEITIREYEYYPTEDYITASCLCPYDLYCEVGPLDAGKYTVIILQGKGTYELYRFTIDYSKGLDEKKTIRELPW